MRLPCCGHKFPGLYMELIRDKRTYKNKIVKNPRITHKTSACSEMARKFFLQLIGNTDLLYSLVPRHKDPDQFFTLYEVVAEKSYAYIHFNPALGYLYISQKFRNGRYVTTWNTHIYDSEWLFGGIHSYECDAVPNRTYTSV